LAQEQLGQGAFDSLIGVAGLQKNEKKAKKEEAAAAAARELETKRVYWRENPEFSIYIYFGISKIFKLWSYYIIWIGSGRIIFILYPNFIF